MGYKNNMAPRRRPQQQRSKATVEAILQAATYILIDGGWEALTTNAVAERAGVNISSLYQYFPNKESIVSELRRRHRERVSSCSSPRHGGTTREAHVSAVRQAVEVYRKNSELFRAFEELPRRHRRQVETQGKPPEALALTLMHGPSCGSDCALATFIAQTAADAVLLEVTLSRPELLSDLHFVDELALLLGAILRGGLDSRKPDS